MNKLKNRNKYGEIITLQQACEETNLCAHTVRKIAKESGAALKIGKSYRIIRNVFLEYIYKNYTS